MICVAIVLGLALVNLLAGLEYPPLLVNVVALGVLAGVIVHNLLDERRVG